MAYNKDQFEPGDSRRVTLTRSELDIEPRRTGPREEEARRLANGELDAERREPTAEELRTGG